MFKLSLFFLFTYSITVFGQSDNSQSEAEIEANISVIQKKLTVLKNKLNSAYGEEQQIITKLEQQDKTIGEISKQVEKSSLQLNYILKQIELIDADISKSNKSIEEQKGQIIKLLKLQVYINHDKTLRMLLANKKTESNIQTKHQIKYLQNRLYVLIKEVAEQIKQLKNLKQAQIDLQQQEIHHKLALTNQQAELIEQRKLRLTILSQLKIEIAKHESESENLSKDQKRLQELLNEIEVLLSDLPKDLGSNKPFKQLKGKMKKPVAGSYIRSFNSKRSANTRWNGVVIKATLGKNIEAIAYGRVAFADWLRGFGLLIILDHQDGYMSLYGFNESLYVEVGDWVDARQNIANIGNSGTLATPAVYFEIRKDAKPLNPKSWVK